MKFVESLTITGRGLVFVVELEKSDPPFRLGDMFPNDGKLYEIRGIEASYHSNLVGIVVRERYSLRTFIKRTPRAALEDYTVYTVNKKDHTEYIGNLVDRNKHDAIKLLLDNEVDKQYDQKIFVRIGR